MKMSKQSRFVPLGAEAPDFFYPLYPVIRSAYLIIVGRNT